MQLGFDEATAAAMPENVAMAWLEAHRELRNTAKKKRYKVLRNKGDG